MSCQLAACIAVIPFTYFFPNSDYILLPYVLLMFVLSVKSHLLKLFEQ